MSADVRESKRPAVIDSRYNAIFSHLLGLSGGGINVFSWVEAAPQPARRSLAGNQ
jgi:hypothetical protein